MLTKKAPTLSVQCAPVNGFNLGRPAADSVTLHIVTTNAITTTPDEFVAPAARPTIREVAALAGVSIATVSRVVNGSGYVSEKTRQAVADVIREHGYTANRARAASPAGGPA